MAKEVLFSETARGRILSGVNLLADAVNDALDARVATAAHRFGH